MNTQQINKKHGVFVEGIGTRIFLYFCGYSFLAFLVIWGLFFGKQKFSITGDITIDYTIIFLSPLVPFIILELIVRNYRKNEGLPIYRNVAQEIKEKYYTDDKTVDNKDLNYYFELKEKGAITQEEYENKKRELLK
jgi:hypothetical protein